MCKFLTWQRKKGRKMPQRLQTFWGEKWLETVVFTMYLQILHSYISFHPLCPLFLTFPIGAKGATVERFTNVLRGKIAGNRSVYYVLTNLTFLHFISPTLPPFSDISYRRERRSWWPETGQTIIRRRWVLKKISRENCVPGGRIVARLCAQRGFKSLFFK